MQKTVSIDNTQALDATIQAVVGRATTWTHSAEDIQEAAAEAERRLEAIRIPKSERIGITAVSLTAGPSSISYRNSVRGSRAVLRRSGKGWQLVGFEIEARHPKQGSRLEIQISQDLAAATLNRIAKANGISFQ